MTIASPPWPITGNWDEERECARCGGTIRAKWRHFWRPCSCTYLPSNEPPHDPDRDCVACEGSGFLPCEPQDLSVLRVSGACSTCGAWSFVLCGDGGLIGVSARHYDDDADHAVVVVGAPLVTTLFEHLDRTLDPPGTER